jgi:hypothetical protein
MARRRSRRYDLIGLSHGANEVHLNEVAERRDALCEPVDGLKKENV